MLTDIEYDEVRTKWKSYEFEDSLTLESLIEICEWCESKLGVECFENGWWVNFNFSFRDEAISTEFVLTWL